MQMLFADYLAANGNWLQSTLVATTRSTQSKELKGKEKFIKYCDLRKAVGAVAAKKIKEEKMRLQLSCGAGDVPYTMPHPDMPTNEARACM